MTGFSQEHVTLDSDPDERIYQSWIQCLARTLGRDPQRAHVRALQEISREHARQFVEGLRAKGWHLAGKHFLDIGSGHGTLAVELALAGAKITALEPCDAWRELSEERAAALDLSIEHVNGDAHALPFADASFDGLFCLQVLEHVRDPKQVVKEMSRVLKPGGRFFVTCENYFAPQEPHYQVFWLPGLPKPLGSVYLRLRGRNPQFLRDHVTYVYWPSLARAFLSANLADLAWQPALTKCSYSHSLSKHRLIYRVLAPFFGELWAKTIIVCIMNRRRLFRPEFTISGQKQAHRSWSSAAESPGLAHLN
jgi:SAM-dependent methyltransferase